MAAEANGTEAAAARFLEGTEEKLKMNQYWYSVPTLNAMVAECEEFAKRAAFLSTPSVYFSLTNKELQANSKLFDLDTQWASDPGFVEYNFKEPEKIPEELHHTFDYVVIDPPFITPEVWELYAKAARLLLVKETEESSAPGATPRGKVLLTTIGEHKEFLLGLLGAKAQVFQPSIPNLIYQYTMYINYDSPRLQVPNAEIEGLEALVKASYRPPTGRAAISSDDYAKEKKADEAVAAEAEPEAEAEAAEAAAEPEAEAEAAPAAEAEPETKDE